MMGYFANGSEGDSYREEYCYRCINWRDKGDGRGDGCAIMDVHLLANYDQTPDTPEARNIADMLNLLIRRDKDGENEECSMFLEKAPTNEVPIADVGRLNRWLDSVRSWR